MGRPAIFHLDVYGEAKTRGSWEQWRRERVTPKLVLTPER